MLCQVFLIICEIVENFPDSRFGRCADREMEQDRNRTTFLRNDATRNFVVPLLY